MVFDLPLGLCTADLWKAVRASSSMLSDMLVTPTPNMMVGERLNFKMELTFSMQMPARFTRASLAALLLHAFRRAFHTFVPIVPPDEKSTPRFRVLAVTFSFRALLFVNEAAFLHTVPFPTTRILSG